MTFGSAFRFFVVNICLYFRELRVPSENRVQGMQELLLDCLTAMGWVRRQNKAPDYICGAATVGGEEQVGVSGRGLDVSIGEQSTECFSAKHVLYRR